MKNSSERIKGTIISYITVILQIAINIFFTPVLIRALGLEEYGLYETINSLGVTLQLMNFGVASIISRYIVKFNKENEKKALENFLAMSTIISIIIFVLIIIVGLFANQYIEILYENSLEPYQIVKARTMFIYITINFGMMSWHNYSSGIITGYEKFAFTSTTKLLKQVLRVVILSILLLGRIDALTIIITDLIITIIIVITELIYCRFKLKVPIKYHSLDTKVLKEVFFFATASIVQAITNQINLSLDKVILGIMLNSNVVAIYSIGMLIVNVMVSILQIINGVYLPEATRLVLEKADGEKLTDLIIKPGRIQSMIGCAIVFGFILIGKEFLGVWVGGEFKEIWLATIILLVFTMLSYVSSVANVILDAMLKKMSRSLILICTAILNVIITIILVKPLGYLGAAIGTALSMFIGNIILLNLYYKVKIGINIPRMYKEIFRGILLSAFLAMVVSFPIKLIFKGDLIRVIIASISFVTCYSVSLIKWGMNSYEINFLKLTVSKLKTVITNFVVKLKGNNSNL